VEQNREHILVVDDEEELRLAIVEILTREGFEVESVASAEEAWTRLSQTAYDVLITDHNLPGKSGVDLLEDTLTQFPETIGIVITGWHDWTAVQAIKKRL
jgi:DNA-binding NtrC family response regulator